MSFDNICKYLCKKFPERYAAWRIRNIRSPVTVLETELSHEPIRADTLILLKARDRILHIEFQLDIRNSEPPVPLRMLDYWVRLYRGYRMPVDQVVVLLKDTLANRTLKNEFRFENTYHSFQVVRLWEEDADVLLQDPALLPLASLAYSANPLDLLNQVAEQVKKIDNISEREEISACAQIIAGLRFEKRLIKKVFQEGMMRESVIYQEILQEGRQEGIRQGLQEGHLKGLNEGRKEGGLALISRQLQRKFGVIEPELQQQLQNLSTTQLEELADVLLDFRNPSDLTNWLQKQ